MNITDDGIWMYECKPIILSTRPWWRHPAFPWGWYSITTDGHKMPITTINALGYYTPSDGGGTKFVWDENQFKTDSGQIITPNDKIGVWRTIKVLRTTAED